jgi:hypothetical protein
MSKPRSVHPVLTTEAALYLLAFGLGLAFRLIQLGISPLTDFEADWALQAWDMIQGNKAALSSQPAYVILTGGLFYLFGGTNAIARLVPALAGSLLIFLPWLLKRFTIRSAKLRNAGLLLAFFLAIDPGLVALSRTAGSSISALSFACLTLGLVADRKPKLAGAAFALALLSGPALLEGFLGLGLAGLAAWMLNNASWLNLSRLTIEADESRPSFAWKQMVFYGVGVFLLVGTGFLQIPQGLGAFAATLPDYLESWTSPAYVPVLRILAALLAYQLLCILFGLISTIKAWIHLKSFQPEDGIGRLLSLWAALAVFTAVIYPRHQVSTVAWALIPLWGLAALALADFIPAQGDNISLHAGLGHAGLTALFLVLIGHNMLRLLSLNAAGIMYAAVVGGIFLMGLIVAFLVAAGWSVKTAQWGLIVGTASVLVLLMVSFTWKASFLYPNSANELWNSGAAAGQIDEIANTISDLSWRSKGQPHELDLVITSNAPSLRWALRFFENAQYKQRITAPETPSVIITPGNQEILSLPASYRGQDLVLREIYTENTLSLANIIRWATFRQGASARETIILWVRNDLFPGIQDNSQSEANQP